jgi:glucose-1-phosphate thymidylyltransferase
MLKVACFEEVAFRSVWITPEQPISQMPRYNNTGYGQYLRKILTERKSL